MSAPAGNLDFYAIIIAFAVIMAAGTRHAVAAASLLLIVLIICNEIFHWGAPYLGFSLGTLAAYLLVQRLELHRNDIPLQLKQRQLTTAHLQMVRQAEEERRMFAMHLHDHVLNQIKDLKDSIVADRDSAQVLESVNKIDGEIRNIMEHLYPSTLTNLGLRAALDALVHHSASLDRKVQVRMRLDTREFDRYDQLKDYQELFVYRFAQEAIANALRHSGASTIILTVSDKSSALGQMMRVEIKDDGCGLPEAPEARKNSRGMAYMQMKADLLDAVFAIERPAQGPGTVVSLMVPLRGADRVDG